MKGNLYPNFDKFGSTEARAVEPVPPEVSTALFLSRWIKAPHRIGALAPSGRNLARAMARQIDPTGDGFVIELGGGTGSITRALLASGLPRRRLIVVERDLTLAAILRMRFPGVKILRGDATQLVTLLRPFGIEHVRSVVSSLPLLSMAKRARRAIVAESFALLGEEGSFIQFTYGVASPLGPEFGLIGKATQWVWWNLPPATVWHFRRRAPVAEVA